MKVYAGTLRPGVAETAWNAGFSHHGLLADPRACIFTATARRSRAGYGSRHETGIRDDG